MSAIRSKTLSLEDRKKIMQNVMKKVNEKWEQSPIGKEQRALIDKCNEIVKKKQLELIPKTHRKILDKYGAGPDRTFVTYNYDEKGEFKRGFGKFFQDFNVDSYFIPGRQPDLYPSTPSQLAAVIHDVDPKSLRRIYDIEVLRKCEDKKIRDTYSNLLSSCNTSKQVFNNEYLKPFLPKYLLDWKPVTTSKEKVSMDKESTAILASMSL
jgi:hypothetical protein